MSDRLVQIEKQLMRLHEQRDAAEDQMTTSPDPTVRTQCRQQFEDHSEKIRAYERERWQLLAARSSEVTVEEPKAEVVVAEFVEQVGQLQSSQRSEAELELLQKIYAIVSQPGTPAAAKLKGVLSSIPPFIGVSYEAEIDTENFLRTHFPTFAKWVKVLAKK